MIFLFIHLFLHFGDIYLRTPRGDILRNDFKNVFTSRVHFRALRRWNGGIFLRRQFMGNIRYLQGTTVHDADTCTQIYWLLRANVTCFHF